MSCRMMEYKIIHCLTKTNELTYRYVNCINKHTIYLTAEDRRTNYNTAGFTGIIEKYY